MQAPLQANMTHSKFCLPRESHGDHVCRRSNAARWDWAGPGIHVYLSDVVVWVWLMMTSIIHHYVNGPLQWQHSRRFWVQMAAKITWIDEVTLLRITKSFLRTQPRSHICIFFFCVCVLQPHLSVINGVSETRVSFPVVSKQVLQSRQQCSRTAVLAGVTRVAKI